MITLVTPEFADYEPSIQNKLDYCAVHGHDLLVGRKVLDTSRRPAWTKLHVVRRHLANYDWLFWTDADALVTDFAPRLDEVLARARASNGEADLYVSSDPRGMNFGHFFLRNGPNAFALIDATLARNDTLDHGCQEQEAVVRVLRANPTICRTAYVPQRLFNSYPEGMGDGPDASWQPGDFICHCPGSGRRFFISTLSQPNVQISKREEIGELFTRLGYQGEGVEVGVWTGEFSAMLRGSWRSGRIHLVDRWAYVPGYRDALNTSQETQDALYDEVCARFAADPSVMVHRADSTDSASTFADCSLDWVYIDADHSYEAVAADLRAWWPKVKVGGLIGGHDFVPDGDLPEGRFGVRGAVLQFLRSVPSRHEPYVTSEPDWPSWYVIKRRA